MREIANITQGRKQHSKNTPRKKKIPKKQKDVLKNTQTKKKCAKYKKNRFPKHFRHLVKTILKRLFRVYGHIYHSHIKSFVELEAEAHVNSCFKHFVYFVKEFSLVDDRELAPLKDIIDQMFERDANKTKYQPKYKY